MNSKISIRRSIRLRCVKIRKMNKIATIVAAVICVALIVPLACAQKGNPITVASNKQCSPSQCSFKLSSGEACCCTKCTGCRRCPSCNGRQYQDRLSSFCILPDDRNPSKCNCMQCPKLDCSCPPCRRRFKYY